MTDVLDLEKIFSRDGFAEVVDGMVTDFAPRLFAVVQVRGDRLDGRVAAWGMAFPEHAEVVTTDGGMRMRVRDADSTVPAFTAQHEDLSASVVWLPAFNSRLDEPAVDQPEEDENGTWW
ncbi:hypothetical protein GCM10022243_04300 [Saccharothrix violaceirubra]|uniref:Uncharacterized protein n=1 Tax=Saccharothrix violaceirubra TaxID=413306 RepID=A0A7W7WT95_9PSEU|nr:hypothetical protein [Saccharothrix violaceirubra]MBB4962839.1 hypothetical protein [Saccharothrix violaceirubra]